MLSFDMLLPYYGLREKSILFIQFLYIQVAIHFLFIIFSISLNVLLLTDFYLFIYDGHIYSLMNSDFEDIFLRYASRTAKSNEQLLETIEGLDESKFGKLSSFLKKAAMSMAIMIGSHQLNAEGKPTVDITGMFRMHVTTDTHSMNFTGKNIYCVRIPFKDLKKGMVVVFHSDWYEKFFHPNALEKMDNFIKKKSDDNYEVPIKFKLKYTSTVHRLMQFTKDGWVSKGDNNADNDPGFVTKDNYWGVVVSIGYEGDKTGLVMPDQEALQAACDNPQ